MVRGACSARAWLTLRVHGVRAAIYSACVVPRVMARAWRLQALRAGAHACVVRVLTRGVPAERTSSISSGAAGAGGFAAALIASLATAADGVAVAARLRAPSWRRSGEAYPGRARAFAQNSALPYGVNYIDVSADALRTPAYCSF